MQTLSNSQTESLTFKMGKYTFEYPKNHSKKKPIHKEAIKIIKKQHLDTLDISWGKYKRYKWDHLLKRIKDCEVERISAYGNSDKNIAKALTRISFFNLTYLDLGECQIENIEQLPVGPSLNYLSLINNYISSVKSLNKYHLPALKTLLLNENPIKQLIVQRCDFFLETYWLERKYNFKTIQESLTQTSLFKLKHEEVTDVSIESIGRIYQPNLILKIHDKFPKLQKLFYIEPEDLFESDTEFVVFMSDDEQEDLQDNNEQILLVEETHQAENENEDPEPPALHFVEGEVQEDWTPEINLALNGMKTKIDEAKQGEVELKSKVKESNGSQEKDEDVSESESESQNESENQSESQSEEMEEESFESSQESSSRWDSGLEQEDEIEGQQAEHEQQQLPI